MEEGDMWEIFVPPSQLCCKPKTTLKRNSLKVKMYKNWKNKENIDTDFLKH